MWYSTDLSSTWCFVSVDELEDDGTVFISTYLPLNRTMIAIGGLVSYAGIIFINIGYILEVYKVNWMFIYSSALKKKKKLLFFYTVSYYYGLYFTVFMQFCLSSDERIYRVCSLFFQRDVDFIRLLYLYSLARTFSLFYYTLGAFYPILIISVRHRFIIQMAITITFECTCGFETFKRSDF